MKTMSVRDIRQRWPAAEKALATEKEIIITRDGTPVARLSRVPAKEKKRKRFDPEEHRRWRESVFGEGVMLNLVEEFYDKDRGERFEL
jgi:antitoxin (DNA-binding transcriptional repressor) of toxin-antitoxin stability system